MECKPKSVPRVLVSHRLRGIQRIAIAADISEADEQRATILTKRCTRRTPMSVPHQPFVLVGSSCSITPAETRHVGKPAFGAQALGRYDGRPVSTHH